MDKEPRAFSLLLLHAALRAQRVWSPCLMSTHANTFPIHIQRERHTEKDGNACMQNDDMKHQLQLYYAHTLLICAIPVDPPIITPLPPPAVGHGSQMDSSTAGCLSVWKTSVILCKVQSETERERFRAPLLPLCSRWSNVHLPPAVCWTFNVQATILLSQICKTQINLFIIHFHFIQAKRWN